MTKAIATRYRRAGKAEKGKILDELCATMGWHRNHARKALAAALRPKVVRPRRPRPPTYGADVVAAFLRWYSLSFSSCAMNSVALMAPDRLLRSVTE